MMRRIRNNDFILITDKNENRYLQIGQIVEIQNYPHSDDVKFYHVQFIDGIEEYNYNLEDMCKVLEEKQIISSK